MAMSSEKWRAFNALLIRVGGAGLAFLMQLLLARWLGLGEYGIYAFVWTWVIIFAGASELGFSVSPQRFIPAYMEAGDKARARGFFRFSYLTGLLCSSAVALIGVGGVYLAGPFIAEGYAGALYLAFICFPLYTLTDIGDGTARARGWMGLALMPTYIARPILIIIITALVHYSGYATTAETVMIASIVATWATGLVQIGLIHLRLEPLFEHAKPIFEGRHWLKVSLPILAADGIYVLFTNVDVLIVGAFLGADGTGLYFAAVKVAALLSLIPFAVSAAWGAKFSATWAADDRAGMERLTGEMVQATFWPTLVGCVGLLIVGPYLLAIFGKEFAAAYPVLVILLAGLFLRASTGSMDRILTLAGQQNRMAIIFGGTLLLNVVLNLCLIPFFGLAGAALATSLSLCAQALGVYLAARRCLGVHAFIIPAGRLWLRPRAGGA